MGLIFLRNRVSGVAPADAYAIGGNSPELVASFLTQEDGTTEGEYFRTGGATDDFTMFTFSRTNNATMFDSTGTLVWAPHNLMDGSHNFDNETYWYSQNITEVASTTNGPDGSTKMWALTDADGSNYGALLDDNSVPFPITDTLFTFEIWITKDNDETRFPCLEVNGSNDFYLHVNTKTGAHAFEYNTASATASIVEAVTGLWRVRVTFLARGASNVNLYPARGTVIGTPSVAATGTTEFGFLAIYRSDLGGMADNPDQPAGLEKYVPTTTAAVYLPRRNAYYYNGTSWVKGGLQLESRAATQLLHGTDSFATQTETVTAQAYTLQFRGTGSIALTGAHTATLNGTGADVLVSLTFTPSAGTLTLTPSGTVDYPQLEVGSTPTSYIPNTAGSGTVTRAAETLSIAGVNSPISATEATLAADVLLTSDGLGPEIFNILSGGNWVRVYPRNVFGTYAQWRPSYVPDVSSAQGGTISAGINQPVTVALGIKANDFVQLAAQGNAGTALATTTITNFSGRNIGISGNITEGSFFYRSIRVWSTKLPAADLITAGTAS